jgi:hypothetical protein
MARMGKFAMPGFVDPPVGTKAILTDFWKNPDVIADVGFEFTGFGQNTGSCVGVSAGDWIFTLAAIQRTLATNPTKAFLPWWPYAYGRTRFNEGDRGQGEGAVDSVMGQTVKTEGVLPFDPTQLPAFAHTGPDGWWIPANLELQWSDGAKIDPKWIADAKQFPVGTVAPLSSTADVRAAIINGYPVIDGCDNYVGNGKVKGTGADSYVTGHYDGRGGHSTCILGVWNHPTDGWLYLYSNQWQTSTYPKDPAGGGRCTVWLTDAEYSKSFRTGADRGETMAASHLNAFPAQPAVLDWLVAP